MKKWILWSTLFATVLGFFFLHFVHTHRASIAQAFLSETIAPYSITSDDIQLRSSSLSIQQCTLYGNGIVTTIPSIQIEFSPYELLAYGLNPWKKNIRITSVTVSLPQEPLYLTPKPILKPQLHIGTFSQYTPFSEKITFNQTLFFNEILCKN